MANGETYYLMSDFPEGLLMDAINDCTQPGIDATDAVKHWSDRLDFRPDPKLVRSCLKECGAWDDEELVDDEENRQRAFWIMMGDFGEYLNSEPEGVHGSDCFSLVG